jgi:hypothetical protein
MGENYSQNSAPSKQEKRIIKFQVKTAAALDPMMITDRIYLGIDPKHGSRSTCLFTVIFYG